ncbi:hypothetical protein GGF46_001365 [Coemansia sp. RSA 552]|nr:hypothetical protein GGF46_001365 [Coemansia sp. RSA 552]
MPRRQSLHSQVYGAAADSEPPPRAPWSPGELTSLYAGQFAASKSQTRSIYQAAVLATTDTGSQSYVHGLTVLQCARSQGPADPHVYRDWLIFEERLKQSYRRLQRKKRSYLVQILAFSVLVLYFAWFGFFGTRSYRFTCKLLSAGSAYCTYLIITNRRFLQSIKYPAQCNRALHQFRLRFETTPLRAPNPFVAAAASAGRARATTPPLPPPPAADGRGERPIESQLSFFPTVPRQLRDGYVQFKATYYHKRDAAKRRMQERQRRSKKRDDTASSPSFRTSERRPKARAPRYDSDHNIDDDSIFPGASALHAGIESATDDSSTTCSSLLPQRTANRRFASGRARSNLVHTLPAQDSDLESEPQSGATPPSP